MKIKNKIKILTAIVIISALSTQVVSTASANTISPGQAAASYKNTVANMKTSFILAATPSATALTARLDSAEAARRHSVKQAFDVLAAVIKAQKAPSLAAESTYHASVLKLMTDPTNTTLKNIAKTNLSTLTAATATLAADSKIAAAAIIFSKEQVLAMKRFNASIATLLKSRTRMLNRVVKRYSAQKAVALASLYKAYSNLPIEAASFTDTPASIETAQLLNQLQISLQGAKSEDTTSLSLATEIALEQSIFAGDIKNAQALGDIQAVTALTAAQTNVTTLGQTQMQAVQADTAKTATFSNLAI